MQALRLRLHQHNAVYRNPISSEIVESYPLVPPSTLLGLMATLLRRELEKGSFNLAIQGTYGALMRDYQWYKKYNEQTGGYQSHRYPLLVHTLYDVKLLIHIVARNDSDLRSLLESFRHPPYFLYLGRAEDIIKIEEANIVNIEKRKLDISHLPYNAYVSAKEADSLKARGVAYKLASYSKLVPLQIKKQTKLIRDFEWEDLRYVERGAYVAESDVACWYDGENWLWWSLPNHPQ
ncbi:type I-B CRISPR-associated protein Cas5b [Nitrososphaera viennensis]|uniref:Type I-B CRISPR-associated protein Cas5b n=2 Tax=Nitrososphaera viennensis TaxID=1034015 RepID=A0A977NLF8_9ARCH|nr:type I-B CRISPR-associated protein Cas5b [Nitrososphaera viennensis]AIC16845.1 putative CRISPR-associated protein Cas5 [Nitrososphaera viennensis EN76]UVS68749.1 type I-B CRISPR-associated protein Cas5b [Nitrososphaera viennensis]